MNRRYVSFLDLMCCGFGGALLMFLIVASAQSSREPSVPMLLIRCHIDEGSSIRSGAELGLQYRRVGESQWLRPHEPSGPGDLVGHPRSRKWYFFPKAASGSGADAVLICNRPEPGQWEVRAYVASTAHLESLGSVTTGEDPAAESGGPIPVVLQVLGATSKAQIKATLRGTADFTEPLRFEVTESDE